MFLCVSNKGNFILSFDTKNMKFGGIHTEIFSQRQIGQSQHVAAGVRLHCIY